MVYTVEFRPRAVRDIDGLSPPVARRVLEKIATMAVDLNGDVKRLTNFSPEYRLRVGDWRVLFEVEADRIVVYRVLHRSNAYQ